MCTFSQKMRIFCLYPCRTPYESIPTKGKWSGKQSIGIFPFQNSTEAKDDDFLFYIHIYHALKVRFCFHFIKNMWYPFRLKCDEEPISIKIYRIATLRIHYKGFSKIKWWKKYICGLELQLDQHLKVCFRYLMKKPNV